jgi:hypothetical protein
MATEFFAQQDYYSSLSDRRVISRFLLGGFLAHKIDFPARFVILCLFGFCRFFCPIRPRARGSSLDA